MKINYELSLKDLIGWAVFIATIVYAFAIQPSQVLSQADSRYASRETMNLQFERLDRIESKIDLLMTR